MILAREDGIVLVAECIRVSHPSTISNTDMRTRLKSTAEMHKQSFLGVKSVAHFNQCVFSKSQGYPAGELAQDYFKSDNFIWCERVSGTETQYLVIGVKDGTVYTDSIVNQNAPAVFWASLFESFERLEIFTFGDVPNGLTKETLSAKPYPIKFTDLDQSGIEAFDVSELEPLGKIDVVIDKVFPQQTSNILIVLVVAVLAIAGIMVLSMDDKDSDNTVVRIDPFESYHTSLNVPTAAEALVKLANVAEEIYYSSKWDLAACELRSANITCEVGAKPGVSLNDISSLEDRLGISGSARIISNKLLLNIPITSAISGRSDLIVETKEVSYELRDRVMSLLPTAKFTFLETVVEDRSEKQTVTISLDIATFSDIKMLAQAVAHLPVNADSVSLTLLTTEELDRYPLFSLSKTNLSIHGY